MQRAYEVMFIVRPDVMEEDMDKLISTLQGHATTAGATVQNTEKMGRREPAESPADHHKVVRLTAIDRLARRVPEGSVAQAVSYLKRPHMATAQAS